MTSGMVVEDDFRAAVRAAPYVILEGVYARRDPYRIHPVDAFALKVTLLKLLK
jgi:hypothetical protein